MTDFDDADSQRVDYRLAARRPACANRLFEVFFDRLEAGQGRTVEDYLIVRPRQQNEDGVGGICVLPERDGRIGLMRGYRHQLDRVVWQAPAGFVEPRETSAETALRELREETGLTCAPDRLVSLGGFLPDAGLIEATVALFVARDAVPLSGNGVLTHEPGVGQLVYFAPDALMALLRTTPDMGASTLVACFRYLALAAEG
ncbi:MAG: NUDIX hydrolase [Alphaproteobacteria bacterium]